jgi:translocation and assembly module TamB
MRRKLLIGAILLLILITALITATFWYVRSGRLDRLLKDQIIAALQDVGVRAEIGETHLDLRGYKVTIDDVKLFAGSSAEPFGSVGSIEASFSVISYLRQRINITSVEITHPVFLLQIDKDGVLNIEALKSPPEKKEGESQIKFLTAVVNVRDAQFDFVDLRHDVSATLANVSAGFAPNDPHSSADVLNHRATVTVDSGSATYQGRPLERLTLQAEAAVTSDAARIDRLHLTSDLGDVDLNGQILSFDPFKYDLKVRSKIAVEQIARVLDAGKGFGGQATFDGTVEGVGADYRATGALAADRLEGAGIRISGLRAKSSGRGRSEQYDATIDVDSSASTGSGVTLGELHLSGARLKGKGDDFDLSGAMALSSLKSGLLTVSRLNGRLTADRKQIGISQLRAGALGGNVTGSIAIAYAGGPSNVDFQFNSLDLNQAATLASAKDVEVRGTAQGSGHLSFPGFDYRAARGRLEASFDAEVASPDSAAPPSPAQGTVTLVASGRTITVESARVRSARSEVTATGTINWDLEGALDVRLKSEDMSDLQRVADSFGLIPQEVQQDYAPGLRGPGEFIGRVEGKISAPTVVGRFSLAGVASHDEEIGSISGAVEYSPSNLHIEHAVLVRPDGSRADLTLNAPLQGENNIAVKGTLQDFPLATIARLAAPGLSDFVGRGVVNGSIDLTGLPGRRSIDGSAQITLTDAELNLPSPEEKEETTKVAVPNFKGEVTISKSVLSVQSLRLSIGDSTVSGSGAFDLDTYAYTIDAEAQQLDLAQVSRAVSETVELTGRAGVKLKGDGKWDDWSSMNLTATIQGESVAINGRDLGDAMLGMRTENGMLKVEATALLLDKTRRLDAVIDLTDSKNLPISASIEFNESDIGPYLALIAPQLSSISGTATGDIRISGPLQDPDKIQAVATLTKLEFGGTIGDGRQYTIANEGDIVVRASPQAVTVDRVTLIGEGTSVTIEGGLSRDGSTASSLSINGELNLRLISSFTKILTTSGIAGLQASIAGSLTQPRLVGVVDLSDVGVRVLDFPLSMARGHGRIRFTTDQAQIETFTASTPGGGSLELSGGATLSGLTPDRWRIETRADQVGVSYPRDTQTVFDADLVLQGNRRLQILSGAVDVRRASYTKELTLNELITTGGPFGSEFLETGPGGGGGPSELPTSLDIRIEADNTLIIRNNLADAVGSAFLNLRGPIEKPAVNGRIQLVRGALEFRNGRYDLTRGVITLPGSGRAQPTVDFQSEADLSGYHVFISFNGPLDKLETTLRSDPELPQGDLISLILTGSISGTIDRTLATTPTALQSGLGLAQSLLSASLSEQLERGTQRLFGLSRLSIDPLIVGRGNDPTARVTVGQRITKDLTITYSQNVTSGSSGVDRIVLVEYRLSNRFSIVGIRNERGEVGFDVRIRRRF